MSKLKNQQGSYILKNKEEKLLNKKRKIKFIKRGIFFIYIINKRFSYFMFKIKLF